MQKGKEAKKEKRKEEIPSNLSCPKEDLAQIGWHFSECKAEISRIGIRPLAPLDGMEM